MRNRAFRRHHRNRMYNHAKHILNDVWHENQWKHNWTDAELHANIAFRANTFTCCSCEMCRNERNSKWSSGNAKLTIQERKADEKYKTELKEIM